MFLTTNAIIGQSPLLIPDYLTGHEMQLTLQEGEVELFQGFSTHTIGYNQNILGPTLILEKGQDVVVDVKNELTETTTLHWHGLHVSAENDGGPHTAIEAGHTWSPSFKVLDNAATYWYHPHLHEHTEEQVTKGAAGFIIVRDDEESNLELPRTYGVDDIPIVIQSRAFDSNKQLLDKTAGDNIIMCNATINAYLDAPAQVIRLRLLNGSTERIYNLGLTNDQVFYQIATDGGLLPSPIELTRLMFAPGERAEILLDLSDMMDETVTLKSYNSELPNGYYGASNPSAMPMGSIAGYTSNILNGSDFEIININVVAQNGEAVLSIPTSLVNHIPYSEDDVDMSRSLTFRPNQMGPTSMVNGPFNINGQSFELSIINQEIPLNNTEVWELTNMSAIAHPFHIHDVQFYILDIDGNPPPPNMQGRKDVVLVPPMFGTVRFITKFEDFADENTPYMYHCHMLSHEDEGMMGQFLVLPLTTIISNEKHPRVSCSPNPAENNVSIIGASESTLRIYDLHGNLVKVISRLVEDQEIDIGYLARGVYILNIEGDKSINSIKLIKI